MAGRETRENKLIALMVNDLGPGFGEKEMAGLEGEVRSLPDEELRRTLAARLDLPPSVDDGALDEALSHVEEPEEISGDHFTGAPDMSHEPRPEEREGQGATRRAARSVHVEGLWIRNLFPSDPPEGPASVLGSRALPWRMGYHGTNAGTAADNRRREPSQQR